MTQSWTSEKSTVDDNEVEASPKPKWQHAMELLKFKLPLRTTKDVLDTEAILHTTEQFIILRNFLRYLIEVREEILRSS
jgi:hypothetical protein